MVIFRITTNHLADIDGWGRSILSRYDHIGIFLEALTGCGVS